MGIEDKRLPTVLKMMATEMGIPYWKYSSTKI